MVWCLDLNPTCHLGTRCSGYWFWNGSWIQYQLIIEDTLTLSWISNSDHIFFSDLYDLVDVLILICCILLLFSGVEGLEQWKNWYNYFSVYLLYIVDTMLVWWYGRVDKLLLAHPSCVSCCRTSTTTFWSIILVVIFTSKLSMAIYIDTYNYGSSVLVTRMPYFNRKE